MKNKFLDPRAGVALTLLGICGSVSATGFLAPCAWGTAVSSGPANSFAVGQQISLNLQVIATESRYMDGICLNDFVTISPDIILRPTSQKVGSVTLNLSNDYVLGRYYAWRGAQTVSLGALPVGNYEIEVNVFPSLDKSPSTFRFSVVQPTTPDPQISIRKRAKDLLTTYLIQ